MMMKEDGLRDAFFYETGRTRPDEAENGASSLFEVGLLTWRGGLFLLPRKFSLFLLDELDRFCLPVSFSYLD
ncbi:unnamed protein product [Blepharisma stoltei]|uniref:Uncharacterized protein n=1 Tax=Blepharisma stoltei TaxID=1481888 RepID=A0AAU9JF17_9CILI|nr:unnamed protein product [Blepharisma stoltei]